MLNSTPTPSLDIIIHCGWRYWLSQVTPLKVSLGSGRILHSERFSQPKIKIFVVSIEYNLFKGEMICYMNNCYLTTNGIPIGAGVPCS